MAGYDIANNYTFQKFFNQKQRVFTIAKLPETCKNRLLVSEEEHILAQYWSDIFVSNREKEKYSIVTDILTNHPAIKTAHRQKFITSLFG